MKDNKHFRISEKASSAALLRPLAAGGARPLLSPWRYVLPCVALLCVLLCSACKDPTSQALMKKGSSGKTLELLVVADRNVYTGSTLQLIDSLFARPQDGLNQVEPLFDVVNIPISSFENADMFRSHRNVLICDVDSANRNKVYKHVDRFAEPQIVYDFAAHDRAALDSMLRHFYPAVLRDLYDMEYRRIARVYTKEINADVMQSIRKQFGFSLTIPADYTIAPPVTGDFMWIRKETKDISFDILIQVLPYTTQKQMEEASVLNRVDSVMKQHVPGPADGSYIGTDRRLPFYTHTTQMGGQYAVETRGVYRCFGDFYSGPFVSYAVLMPDKKQMVLLTAFLYSPRKDKRDLLMQVEGICHTLTFNG